ncbi:MAG: hypothetical protein AAFR17_17300 [Pseudomonadota bacterium]
MIRTILPAIVLAVFSVSSAAAYSCNSGQSTSAEKPAETKTEKGTS